MFKKIIKIGNDITSPISNTIELYRKFLFISNLIFQKF